MKGSESDASSSSSSSSTAADVPGRPSESSGAQRTQAEPEGADTAHSERAPVDVPGGLARIRQEHTHEWGRSFLFTYRRPHTWQARCAYHARHSRTRCTKSLKLKDDSPASREQGLLRLKLWCVDACNHSTRESHMGSRGLKELSEEQAGLTAAQIDALEAAMPDPPE